MPFAEEVFGLFCKKVLSLAQEDVQVSTLVGHIAQKLNAMMPQTEAADGNRRALALKYVAAAAQKDQPLWRKVPLRSSYLFSSCNHALGFRAAAAAVAVACMLVFRC